jgi:starch synthase (maltosyl-transferring)
MAEGPRIYNLFPPLVGPIARWREELPRIAAMGFDTVYVNPFHESGFSGSLYAVKDYFRLNPLFAEDGSGDGERQLADFVADAVRHGLRPMMDLVINHTARDSELVRCHPAWFARDAGGAIRSPSAIDPADAAAVTVWGDLAEIDHHAEEHRQAIIDYFRGVLDHYIALGFHAFRCDAAYQVPAAVWRSLIAAARRRDPDRLFCAETLGAPLAATRQLEDAGFDYLFNSIKWWDFTSPWLLEQYDMFRRIAPSIGFPESHDTERLVTDLAASGIVEPARIEAEYRLRYAVAACFASGVMMPIGYEFGWQRRLDVVRTRPRDVEEKRFDLSNFIAGVNAMKRATPALNVEGPQRRIGLPDSPLVLLARQRDAPACDGAAEWAFTIVNTDATVPATLALDTVLEAAEGCALVLDEVTPGERPPAEDPLNLTVPPRALRVLRGQGPPPARSRTAKPSARKAAQALHPDWRRTDRIIIEEVYPEIDGGRYPVKRIAGDVLDVWADIFRDGHDKLAAALRWRGADDGAWRETPMRFFDNDRWVGSLRAPSPGLYRYTIVAWTDHFASWRDEVGKKRAAGQSIALELQEGRTLVEHAVGRAKRADATRLRRILKDCAAVDERRCADLLLSTLVQHLMARTPDRADEVIYRRELELRVDRPAARFGAWYEIFPRSQGTLPDRSATFDDCIRRLPAIAALDFDVLYLTPIHPIGRVNRKGRDNALIAAPDDPGSPYAIGAAEGGHCALHSALGDFDDFRRFLGAVRDHGMELAIDFAVQCAPDHPWTRDHPAWFNTRPDGTLKYAENPPKKYEDIVNVDFYGPGRESLWHELRDTVLFWVAQGVHIFRVDNPHTKPAPFWEWCIRTVQARHPETIFLAEAFTRPKMMRLLAKSGFTQSYSYFTWRNTKRELTDYLTELTQGPAKEYMQPNFFANTPDILPYFLQGGGRPAFLIRLVLAATLSPSFGIYSGFELCENAAIPGREEYLHSEKYEYKTRDWDRPGHIKNEIAALNRFRRANPALHGFTNLRFYEAGDDNILFYGKAGGAEAPQNTVLVAVNLDPHAPHEAAIVLPLRDMGLGDNDEFVLAELFSDAHYRWRGAHQRLRLDPQICPAAIFRLTRSDG